MILKNNFICGFIILSLLFLSSCGENVVIKGKIFIEDDFIGSDFPDSWKADEWLDYTDNGVKAKVRSGDVVVDTDNDGTFEIVGVATSGDLLLEVSMEEYQTSYINIALSFDDEGDSEIEEESLPSHRIVRKDNEKVPKFYDTSLGSNRRDVPFSDTDEIYHVSGFLLKEKDPDNETNWNVFKYAN